MIHIEVKGFQSAEDVKFVIDGFTVIVGRSNIGKSALVRALKYALTNAEGMSFVRHGPDCARTLRGVKTCKCFSSVHIVTESFDLLWEKGDSVNRYVFNGDEYDHPGKGIPEFLKLNGVAPVKVGDESGCIQISDQFYPIFLLDQSGGVAAETISDVSKLTRINKATKLVEKDRREAQSTKKVREGDVDKLRIRLCNYDGLDEALERVSSVESRFEAIEVVGGRLDNIKGYISKITTLGLKIRGLASVTAVKVPETAGINQLVPKVEALSKLVDGYSRRSSAVSSLEWVEDVEVPDVTMIPGSNSKVERLAWFVEEYQRRYIGCSGLEWVDKLKVPDVTSISDSSSRVIQLSRFATEYSRRKSEVEALEWVEKVEVPDTLTLSQSSKKLGLFDFWISKLRGIKSKFDVLDKVAKVAIPDADTLQGLQGKLSTLSRFATRAQSLQKAIDAMESELVQVEAEERALESEIQVLGVCPTCVRPLTLDHTHA